jgi:ABC-2 type transport system permease protein
MKALAVARKNVIELLREPQLLALTILAPLLFLVATIVSYPRLLPPTYPILVVSTAPGGRALIDELEAWHYPDGRPAFSVTELADPALGEPALEDKTAAVLLKITPGGSGIGSSASGTPALSVTLRGDALYGRYYEATSLLETLIRQHLGRLAGQPESLRLVERPLYASRDPARLSPQHEYDLYVPGMIMFAILLLVPQTAMLLGRELRAGTLRRLRLSLLSARDLLVGVSAAQMVVAVVQIVAVFVCAALLGFHSRGPLALAVVVGLAVSFSAIGQGLIVACFIANDSQAVNYGSVVTMLQVMISGSFFPMPAPTVLAIAGHEMSLFDLCPATHGMLLLQQVMCYGASWSEIGFRLVVMLALSLLYFAIGVLVFQRLQMRET